MTMQSFVREFVLCCATAPSGKSAARLLTGEKPVYLTAEIVGDHRSNSKISDTPTWSPPTKIVAKYLAPYLDTLDHASVPT